VLDHSDGNTDAVPCDAVVAPRGSRVKNNEVELDRWINSDAGRLRSFQKMAEMLLVHLNGVPIRFGVIEALTEPSKRCFASP
jgi:hypothetical protein